MHLSLISSVEGAGGRPWSDVHVRHYSQGSSGSCGIIPFKNQLSPLFKLQEILIYFSGMIAQKCKYFADDEDLSNL